ncbi:MAG: hypothetical protein L0177_02960, partial [Chloroflexi bacterium]|nr:hypothetical protein [Chloroflexota bacterium]
SSPASGPEDIPLVMVDHHRPGDPGFGKPPSEYWRASSIGQVWNFVVNGEHVPDDQRMAMARQIQKAVEMAELTIAAAADHCLAAAYRGDCPGVDPTALRLWRAITRAEFQNTTPWAILATVQAAKAALLAAPVVMLAGHRVADLRGHAPVPELPEAACQEGIPFLASLPDKSGRTKVVLQAAPPEVIQAFLEGASELGLIETYGDPARGFAGGYLQ